MKTFAVLLLLGAQVCYISGFSSAKEGKCPTPKGIKKCFLKKRICFMDIECRGKMKCCPDVCGNNVCTRAIIPPGPTVGSCPADDRVVRSNMQNNKCRQKRTKYCFKDNCKKCCYYMSTCNPHPNLLNSLEACEKDLCARKKCRGQGEICQLNKRRQKVKCVCPKRCPNPNGDESVCGTDKITYISPCEMNLTACVLGDRIAIDYRGPCRKNKVTISQGHVDSVTLKAGTNGSVVCQFKGHPIQIVWNKAGIDRLPEDRMLPYDNMLYIRLVRKEDAGKYLCSAFDGVSTVTATVNVSVVVPELVTSKAIQPRRICMQPKLTGPGRDFKVRYYFNSKTRLCEPFVYGGTGGNNNNFKSSERCKRACYHSATPSEICRLPKRPGGCRRIMPKWYFDPIQGKCKIFHYGGCDGNANRFNSEQECLQTCSNLACRLPKAVGNCKAYLARWFFNVVSQQCEKFMYTGCEGNANQYPSLEHCKMKCMKAGARQGPGYKKLTVKPGMCPKFDVARCGDFMWDRCMVDTDCKGSEKCCYNGCIKKCFRPNRKSKKPFSPVKLGVCPPPSFSGKVCSNRYQTNMCLVDQDCPGEHKCCYNGCNSDCVLPPKIPNGKPKPGICPLADVINPNLCGKSTNECSSDGDCYGPFKCCFTGCHQECLPVPKPRTKPGQCPVQDYIDPEICFDSADRCAFDEQCPGSSKCCFTGCKLECLSPPGISRPGICPRTWKGRNGNCDRRGDSCKADSDCGVGNRKCCFNGCQKDCIAPHQPQPGCPKPWKKPDGICDRLSDACQSDSECPSNGKCCFNGCQKYCETGIKPTPPKKPEPVGQCPKPWKDKRFCDNMGDSCRDESDCFGHYRCCYNGCQKDCVKPVNLTKCQIERQKALDQLNDEFPPVGLFVPTCEKSGHYTDKQCHGHVGHCWCVGKDGNEISGTRTPGPLNCDKKDLCEGVTCPFHGMCQAHSNGSTSCVCQMGCTFDYRPVCGSDGVTHTNLCSMKATACSTKTMITVDHDGECKQDKLECLSYLCQSGSGPLLGNSSCEPKKIQCDAPNNRCLKTSVTIEPVPGMILKQEIGNCTLDMVCESGLVCNTINSTGVDVKSCKVECCKGDMCNKPTIPQTPIDKCPKPWKGQNGICDRRGDSCKSNDFCKFGKICCFNGCQKDCVYPDGVSPCQRHLKEANRLSNMMNIGHFTPSCHANGHYNKVQCRGSTGYCWCSDIYGNEKPNTRIRGRPNCNLNAIPGAVPGVNASCPQLSKGRDGICDRMADQCTIDSTCSGTNDKCCFNGCQRECIDVLAPPTDLCEGVTCPFHGMCQAHSNGSTSCVCQMGCTFDYRPVCGSDGVTHTNLCSMKATACSTKTMITVDYDGECKKNGSGLKCLSYQCADSKLNIFGKCETTETVCSSMMDRCTRLSVTVQAIPGIASSIFRQEIGMCITQQICASEMACGSLNSSGIAVKSCKVHCCIGDNCNTPTFNSSKKVDKCPKPWKGQNGICDRRGDSCKSNDFCKFGKICCFNGCQKDCVYPDGASPCQKEANRLSNMMNIGHFTPSCHANGHYNKVQCHGSTGYCWCSDIYGNEKPNTRIRGRPNCNLNAIPGAVPGVNASCPQLSKGRDGICDRMADQCTIDSTCSGTNDKCCFNGCQRECIDVLAPPTDLCEGVTCPFHGMCEADSNGNTSCVCQMACNFDYRPVCGSDGVTHANLCSMKATACSTKTMITVDHDGECKQDKLECWTYMCSGPLLGNSSCEPKKIQCVAPNNRCLKTSVTIEPVPGMILKQEIGNCTLDMVCESGLVCNTINSTGVDVKSCKVECCKGDMCNKPTIPQTPKPDKQKCPKPWKGDKGFCDLRGSMCDSSSDCNFGKICCFNGCQKDCVYPDGQSPCHKNRKDGEAKSAQGMVGNFIPSCHADGHYDRVQCSGSSGYCWCADEEGNERPNTRIRGRPNCNLNAIPGAVRGVNASCPQPSKGRDGICDRMGDQCTTDSTCSGTNDKCCFNGCQRECIDVLAPPKDLCEGVTCPFEGICQANSDGSTSCICPSICTADYKLVCGSTNKTYGNLCAMKVESCQTESIITVIYDGECKKGKTVGNKDCPKPWKGSQGFCDYRGDMCDTKNDDCELGQICCHNGCQNDCVFPVGKSPCQKQLKSAPGQFVPMVGQFVPSCQANGHYNKVQCHPSTGYCWCSDMFGNELPFTHTRGKPNCNLPSIPGYVPGVNGTCPQPYKGLEGICDRMGDMCTLDNDCNENKKCCFNGCQRECMNATPAIPPPVIIPELSQCQKKLKETKRVPGLYLPTCNVDGDFTPVQCHTSVGECWCVNVNNGEEITSTRINTRGGAIRNCSDEAFTKCQRHYRDSLDNPPMGRFLPSCEDGGKYDPMQCHGSVGHCWCVDDDGNELNGTRVRGRPDCSPIANPCDGVKCGFNAVCQASKDGSTSCECPLACPANYAPVCGSDVNTYSNECEMKTVSCTKKMMITVVSDGECPKPPCDNIKCSHKMQQCLVVNDKPVCECPKMKCSDSYSPVCGTDGKVYRNSCQLMNSACSTSQDIDVAYHGECIDKESCDGIRCTHPQQMCTVLNNKAVCECPQYQCPEEGKKEVCGTDKTTYDGPCEMESYACHYNMNITVAHKGKCKGGDADPCAVQMCAHPLQTCQVMSGKAKCICRKVTTTEYMPVCASDGKTYPNTMTMENAGCERNMALAIVKRGKCDEPDPCEKVSCSHPQQSCRAVNGSAKCVCRMMANKKYAPVCASDGNTYSNTMIMQNAGCEKDIVLTIVKRGKCSDQPKPKDLCEDACSYPESKCTVVNNTATCECPTACTRDINPVCGSDGVTYDNMCLLEVEACEPENVDKLTLNHKGACKSSSVNSSNPCEISLCAFPTIRCEVKKGQPVCKCPQICTAIYAPVCASDGKTYPSDCKLAAEACKPEYNGSLTKLHNGACPPQDLCEISLCSYPDTVCVTINGSATCKCPDVCTRENRPVCGTDGKTYPNSCNLNVEACKPENRNTLREKHDGPCAKASSVNSSNPCEISLCAFPTIQCEVEKGQPVCKCPQSCTEIYDPVCASDGKTYPSDCNLAAEACKPEYNGSLTMLHKGACPPQGPCDIYLCSYPDTVCVTINGSAACKCPDVCTTENRPVCGTDGKTYPNSCNLNVEACKPENRNTLREKHDGPCPKASSVNSSNPCEISLCAFPTIRCEVEKGQPVCKCPQICTAIYAPVCASDGKTYPSDCKLAAEACKPEYNGSLTKLHNGACPPQDPCEISLCSYPDTVCVTINGSATCKCPEVCTKEHRPVCGTDGKTYSNSCNLNVEACKPENRNTLRKKHDGPCPKASKASSINSSNPCEISLCAFPTIRCEVEKGQPVCKCPQICTEIYAPVCASDGKTYPSDCKLAAEACKPEYNGSLTMLHKGACPPQDPCEISLCSYPDTVCITINGSATCKCPEVCTRELRPVCGTDGKTYPNSCNLNVQACKPENRQTLRKQHDGPCKSKRQCPRVDLKPCPPVLVGGNCTSDNDCSKSMMCCHTGCARQCVPPQKSPSPRGNDNFNPCDITLCAFPSIKCIVNKGQPKCMCPTSCNRKRAPVCGTDGKTYSNLCTFATSVCNTGGQLRKHLSVLKHDACTAKDVCGLKPASGPCFAYIPSYFFNKTSGKCEQFTFGGCQGNENRFTSKKKCQDACGAFKPCDFVKCSKPYATCKEDNLGLAQCVCPRFCPKLHQPVVASNGKTYSNPCLMRVASCESGIRIVAKPRPKPGPPGAPGKCPATDPKPCPPGPKIAGCKDDSQCAGTHKCCHDGCSKRCVMQMITPPRQCPQINPKKCDRKYDKKEYCKINADCPRSQICCFDGCIKRCDFFGPSPPGGRPGGHHGGAPGSRPGGRPGSRPGMGHGRGQAGNN